MSTLDPFGPTLKFLRAPRAKPHRRAFCNHVPLSRSRTFKRAPGATPVPTPHNTALLRTRLCNDQKMSGEGQFGPNSPHLTAADQLPRLGGDSDFCNQRIFSPHRGYVIASYTSYLALFCLCSMRLLHHGTTLNAFLYTLRVGAALCLDGGCIRIVEHTGFERKKIAKLTR